MQISRGKPFEGIASAKSIWWKPAGCGPGMARLERREQGGEGHQRGNGVGPNCVRPCMSL